MSSKTIPNKDALSIIEESIAQGSPVKLTVKGNSMSPLLIDGKDTVILEPCYHDSLEVGDIIFFRYRGSFLLHRIVVIDKDNGTITTKGDALNQREIILIHDVIALAKVTEINYF